MALTKQSYDMLSDEIKILIDQTPDLIGGVAVEETFTLADGQLAITLDAITTENISVYLNGAGVDNGRLVKGTDFTTSGEKTVVLYTSYPAGSTLSIVQDSSLTSIPVGVKSKKSVAFMKGDVTLQLGDQVQTKSYYTGIEGGGATYEIVLGGTGTDDGGSYIDLDNGLQARLIHNGVVNTSQFGAVGGADDHLFIQSAFSSGVKSIHIPRSYTVLSMLTVGSGTKITFAPDVVITCGTQTTLFYSPNGEKVEFFGANTIIDLNGNTMRAIHVEDSNNQTSVGTLSGVHISGFAVKNNIDGGINYGSGAGQVKYTGAIQVDNAINPIIENCIVEQYGYDLPSGEVWMYGYGINYCKDFTAKQCSTKQAKIAIDVAGTEGGTIQGGTLADTKDNAVYILSDCSDVTTSGVTIDGCEEGVVISSTSSLVSGCKVLGCTISGATNKGISLRGADGAVISGNIFSNCLVNIGDDGAGSNQVNCTIFGNGFSVSDAAGYSIYLRYFDGLSISGNTHINTTSGVSVFLEAVGVGQTFAISGDIYKGVAGGDGVGTDAHIKIGENGGTIQTGGVSGCMFSGGYRAVQSTATTVSIGVVGCMYQSISFAVVGSGLREISAYGQGGNGQFGGTNTGLIGGNGASVVSGGEFFNYYTDYVHNKLALYPAASANQTPDLGRGTDPWSNIFLKSPDGTVWKVFANDAGILSVVAP